MTFCLYKKTVRTGNVTPISGPANPYPFVFGLMFTVRLHCYVTLRLAELAPSLAIKQPDSLPHCHAAQDSPIPPTVDYLHSIA